MFAPTSWFVPAALLIPVALLTACGSTEEAPPSHVSDGTQTVATKPKPTYPTTTTAAPPAQPPRAPDRGVAQQALPNQGPAPGSQ